LPRFCHCEPACGCGSRNDGFKNHTQHPTPTPLT
jgi:hypothetical protein